ncbi:MAG: hypothetical protein EBE86_001895 [Hormoscilla sp. GUM202]|nr:hypothetical protein [Hormoscilla sp. GUM202]
MDIGQFSLPLVATIKLATRVRERPPMSLPGRRATGWASLDTTSLLIVLNNGGKTCPEPKESEVIQIKIDNGPETS